MGYSPEELGSIPILQKIWRSPDDPELDDLKPKYTKKQAVKFFENHITQEKNGFVVDIAMLKQLNATGRLIPEYGFQYSGLQLMQYLLETKSR